ncbi:protein of unknown function DUF4283 - like 10 [Theobroma cacao]|nr:protein of unknown function DUF4283 - like 10 [Theobroma cacao]
MDGGLIVVSFDDEEDMKCLLSLYKEIFTPWFKNIRPYYEWLQERKVLVWVKLDDIPIFLWQKVLFEGIGNSWGRLVKVDKDTEEKRRFDCAMILVEVLCKSKITPMIRVEAKGLEYWTRAQIIGATGTFSADIESGKFGSENRENIWPEQTNPPRAEKGGAVSGRNKVKEREVESQGKSHNQEVNRLTISAGQTKEDEKACQRSVGSQTRQEGYVVDKSSGHDDVDKDFNLKNKRR